jgi:hypothetical protein
MRKFPPHAACCLGVFVLCAALAFDLLLVRAVVVESDWQQDRFCQFNRSGEDCR